MSSNISINETNLITYAVSIESLLDGRTDISGIYIIDTFPPNGYTLKLVTEDGSLISPIEDESTPIENSKGKYYDKSIDGKNIYIVILDDLQYILPDQMASSYILYTLPEPEEYPLGFGLSYTPTSTDTYKLIIDPNSTPELVQQVVEDISGIPPRLSDYSLQRVLKAFNNEGATTPFINNFKVYETITEDIKAQSQTLEDGTTIRPQFKSYNAYLAYKNSLNNRNYVRKNP
jgi:hypothetical protein